ncbi:apical junction component 1 homolog [Ixodes scapularis]|nr:apical junction component 1 homolog [Ixodes scapularis]
MTVRCHWGDCNKAVPKGPNGKVKVHTCPTCYGYFCSRACRGRHRDAKRCPFTRVSNLCQEVLHRIRHDPTSRHQLSLCAQRGLLSRGRGVIRLVFQGPQRAAQFLEAGWGEVVRGQMFYVARDDLLPHDMGPRVYARVRALCDDYDPGRKFVLLVAVCVTQEVVTPAGLGAISREMVVKAMKLRLSGPLPEEDVQTLILPVVSSSAVPPPAAGSTSNGLLPQHRHRLQGLHHVERQLEARGIDLAGSYPELYAKIRAFVDSGELFAPVCTFPVDVRTGQVFMCIVLPWADQELLDRMAGTRSAASVRNKKRWAF